MSFGKDAVAFIFEMQSEIIIYLSRYWLDHTLKPNVRAQVWYNPELDFGLTVRRTAIVLNEEFGWHYNFDRNLFLVGL